MKGLDMLPPNLARMPAASSTGKPSTVTPKDGTGQRDAKDKFQAHLESLAEDPQVEAGRTEAAPEENTTTALRDVWGKLLMGQLDGAPARLPPEDDASGKPPSGTPAARLVKPAKSRLRTGSAADADADAVGGLATLAGGLALAQALTSAMSRPDGPAPVPDTTGNGARDPVLRSDVPSKWSGAGPSEPAGPKLPGQPDASAMAGWGRSAMETAQKGEFTGEITITRRETHFEPVRPSPRDAASGDGRPATRADGKPEPMGPAAVSRGSGADAARGDLGTAPSGLAVPDRAGAAETGLPLPTLRQLADGILAGSGEADRTAGTETGKTASQVPDRSAAPAGGPVKVLSIELQPADLGTVAVRMRLAGGALQLDIQTSNHETARLIGRDRETLAALLRSSGYSADVLSIHAAGDFPAQQNAASGQSGSQHQSSTFGSPGQSWGGSQWSGDSSEGRFGRQRNEAAVSSRDQGMEQGATSAQSSNPGDLYI